MVAHVDDEGAGEQEEQTGAGQGAEDRHGQAEQEPGGSGDLQRADVPVGGDGEPDVRGGGWLLTGVGLRPVSR